MLRSTHKALLGAPAWNETFFRGPAQIRESQDHLQEHSSHHPVALELTLTAHHPGRLQVNTAQPYAVKPHII